jgi:nucleolar protein 56
MLLIFHALFFILNSINKTMRIFIVTTPIGVFALDESNKIVSFRPFPKDPSKIAEKIRASETKIIEEEQEIVKEFSKGKYEIVFSLKKEGVKNFEPGNKAEVFVKENLRALAIEKGIFKDQVEFNELLSKVGVELSKEKMKVVISRDALIVQGVRAVEEIEKTLNVFIERLREWYSFHFPEMSKAIKSHEKFVNLVAKFGSREKIEDPEISLLAEKSIGMNLSSEDIKTLQFFAQKIIELQKLHEELAGYVEKITREIAPNFAELATPMLAAKFISKAGGLERVAKMASSTIQLLGSEKALFRYLHGKGKPPKHGLIFNHPLIQKAPAKFRGKIARVLASKLSMAAKIDFFTGKYKADELKKELEERVKEILSSK